MTTSVRAEQAVHGGEGDFVLTAAVIADLVGGELHGDPDATVRGVAPLDRATAADLSFLGSAKYVAQLEASEAGIVLISPELAASVGQSAARVIVSRPQEALLALVPRLYPSTPQSPGIHPSATIGRGSRLGARVRLGANAVIGDRAELGDDVVIHPNVTVGAGVTIGNGSEIQPNVTLYSGSVVGKGVRIHAGARIGSDGFGYVFRNGRHEKIPHVGRCVIEDDVEIGANTTIDRGSIDDTVIGAGTRIDNLVHIAHNVRIGRSCLIIAQAGISGSAKIEDGCIVAGQAGLGGHITIGRGARIGAQAGVFGDVPAGETWSGYPARPHKESLRAYATLFKLVPYVSKIERFFRSRDGDGKE